jgi:hypothetical protein
MTKIDRRIGESIFYDIPWEPTAEDPTIPATITATYKIFNEGELVDSGSAAISSDSLYVELRLLDTDTAVFDPGQHIVEVWADDSSNGWAEVILELEVSFT